MTKKPVLTLKRLASWLRRQPKSEKYHYFNNEDCLMCRFVRSQGFKGVHAGGDYVRVDNSFAKKFPLSDELSDVAKLRPHSYAGALRRVAVRLARAER